MRNQNGGNTLNEYFIKIEEKVKTLYEGKDDEQELKKLLSQIDLIKLDDDNDFRKTFENQMNFLINQMRVVIFLILNIKLEQIF